MLKVLSRQPPLGYIRIGTVNKTIDAYGDKTLIYEMISVLNFYIIPRILWLCEL